MGIFSALQVIFIVLKVLELIDWPWWEVFIPSYVGVGVTLFLVFILFMLDSGTPTRKKW